MTASASEPFLIIRSNRSGNTIGRGFQGEGTLSGAAWPADYRIGGCSRPEWSGTLDGDPRCPHDGTRFEPRDVAKLVFSQGKRCLSKTF